MSRRSFIIGIVIAVFGLVFTGIPRASAIEFNQTLLPLPLSDAVTLSSYQGRTPYGLHDNTLSNWWGSAGHDEHLASSEWAAVLLPVQTTIDRIRIYPRAGKSNVSLGFPKDFVIQYAYFGNDNGLDHTCDLNDPLFNDANNWKPLLTRFGYPQPSNAAIDFGFGVVNAQCVRIFGAELSQDDYGARYLQMAEIEVFAGEAKLDLINAQAVTKSSTPGWIVDSLIDGITTTAWSSISHQEHLAGSEWAAVLLPAQTTIHRIRLYPRRQRQSLVGLSEGFLIQYSFDGSDQVGRHTCEPADLGLMNSTTGNRC